MLSPTSIRDLGGYFEERMCLNIPPRGVQVLHCAVGVRAGDTHGGLGKILKL